MAKTVLVTGGSGYIAGWCANSLLERGYQVRSTVRGPEKTSSARAAAGAADPTAPISFPVADLCSDQGWDEAMDGVDHVLHVASPLGLSPATSPEEIIDTAKNGALRVLRAAARAGVKRVVMTSAANTAMPAPGSPGGVCDETVWSDPAKLGQHPYAKSKTVAELAAWDFVQDHCDGMELTTVLPGAVFGPLLTRRGFGSADVIARMLSGRIPATPRISLEVVDVRDLADVHIRAMESPRAAGERFLATGEALWMREIGQILRAELGDAGRKAPVRELPDFLVRLAARFDGQLAEIAPQIGRKHFHSAQKARQTLGWRPRPAKDAVVACARSLLESEPEPSRP